MRMVYLLGKQYLVCAVKQTQPQRILPAGLSQEVGARLRLCNWLFNPGCSWGSQSGPGVKQSDMQE